MKMKVHFEINRCVDEISNAEWRDINKLKRSGNFDKAEIKSIEKYYNSIRE